jgi:hypothetical protein
MKGRSGFPQKLSGHLNWTQQTSSSPPGTPVLRAIFRTKNTIVLNFEHSEWHYSGTLERTDRSRFSGVLNATHGSRQAVIDVHCSLFENEDGYFLFGRWLEDGDEWTWWAAFEIVEHFKDEIVDA